MTPILLVDALIEFIETVVKDFELQTNVKDAPPKSPQVIGGYLHKKKPDGKQNPPDFPFVIVRYLEDDDTDEVNTAKIRIIAGTYSEDESDGWRDCMNVITRIKVALLKQRFIGGSFKIERPIITELPEEQPYPEWVAMMTLTVTIPQVQEEGGYLADVFE
jgi:hypothetical protein